MVGARMFTEWLPPKASSVQFLWVPASHLAHGYLQIIRKEPFLGREQRRSTGPVVSLRVGDHGHSGGPKIWGERLDN